MSTRYRVRPVLDHATFTCGYRWKVLDTGGATAELLGVFNTEEKANEVAAALEQARTAGQKSPRILDKLAEHVPNASLSIIGLGEGATVEWVGGEPFGPDSFPGEDFPSSCGDVWHYSKAERFREPACPACGTA